MSRHAQIEEISDTDSDPMDMDPSDFEPTNSKFPLQPRQAQASHPSTSSASASLLNPSNIPFSQSQLQQLQQQQEQQSSYATTKDLSPFKAYQCIYPVYFDARRSRSEGRRVGKELAVENPLARDIVDAVQLLGLKALFEPGKIHPKDWSNPGRVKVLVKVDGKAVRPGVVNNKHHLYTLIATHLLAHPTTESSPHRLRVPNFPSPDPNKPIPPPAIPKGWKMGTILPLHSPALSGGGVSESMFREMMADMQNDGGGAGGGGGLPGLGGLGGMGGMAGLMGEMMGGGGGGGGSDSGGVGKKKIKEKEKDKKKKGRA